MYDLDQSEIQDHLQTIIQELKFAGAQDTSIHLELYEIRKALGTTNDYLSRVNDMLGEQPLPSSGGGVIAMLNRLENTRTATPVKTL